MTLKCLWTAFKLTMEATIATLIATTTAMMTSIFLKTLLLPGLIVFLLIGGCTFERPSVRWTIGFIEAIIDKFIQISFCNRRSFFPNFEDVVGAETKRVGAMKSVLFDRFQFEIVIWLVFITLTSH